MENRAIKTEKPLSNMDESAETIYGMSVLVPDLKANSAYLQKVIYGK